MVRLKQKITHKEYSKLEGMMWVLRKQHECLSEIDNNWRIAP